MKKILNRTRNVLFESCNLLELFMALVVLAAILIACCSLGSAFIEFWEDRFSKEAFLVFVGYVFNILIGIDRKSVV